MNDPSDPHDLARFVAAQAHDFDRALAELRAGAKRTHWIWYVLPQRRELGRSGMARRYGIGSTEEARAYLQHPLLGPRLRACVEALLALPPGHSARSVLGEVDALKCRSCLTLFAGVAEPGSVFEQALSRFYAGERDPLTLALN